MTLLWLLLGLILMIAFAFVLLSLIKSYKNESSHWDILLILVLLPLLAFGLYFMLGASQDLNLYWKDLTAPQNEMSNEENRAAQEVTALSLKGIQAFQSQNYTEALSAWNEALKKLQQNGQGDGETAQVLQRGIEHIKMRLSSHKTSSFRGITKEPVQAK